MDDISLRCDQVGKKYHRSLAASILPRAADSVRRMLRRPPTTALGPDEFWALHEVSFAARRGECLGIIGPNGAGKSTLLKLISGEIRPTTGTIQRKGAITSLIRIGAGLQPLLTGRENIYIKCAEQGYSKTETDVLLQRIVAFSGLERSLDQPVKRYSDGMYARLEFSIVTATPMDVLLIDEVLATGDIAFQMRCLQRLDELKRAGTTILFVSHSEMNVRHIADRCLLLFDGEALALGETDALFRRYYEATGFLNRPLQPLGLAPSMPADFDGSARLTGLWLADSPGDAACSVVSGQSLRLGFSYEQSEDARHEPSVHTAQAELVLQFWSAGGLLMASFDSGMTGSGMRLEPSGMGTVELPFLGLTAGVYRLAGGFRVGGRWLGYRSDLLRLPIRQSRVSEVHGLLALQGRVSLDARAA